LQREVDDRFSLHGEVTSPLDYYLDLVGLDNGLMGFIDNPVAAKMVLAHFSELVAALADRMCDAGVDAIKLSSPFAGAGFLSLAYYRQFVLPYEAKIAAAVRAKGVHCYTHTCGSIGDRLELIFDSGVSGIECLDPPPLGNVELAAAKRRTQGKGFIKGNVDSVNTLLYGSQAEILADAEQRIRIGKEGGGFILSTACSIAPGVKPEHVLLLWDAVEKWGRGE
jgi:uroporphyrinogen decarboxylase